MKKALLFIIAAVIAITANSQQVVPARIYGRQSISTHSTEATQTKQFLPDKRERSGTRVSALSSNPCIACARWYDYVDSGLALNLSLVNQIGFWSLYLWNDTTGVFGYDSAYGGNNLTSLGLLFDPFAEFWNDCYSFNVTEMGISDTNHYSIDSLEIAGQYARNPSKPTVIDTLIVQLVSGNGSATSNLPLGVSYPPGASDSLLTDYGLATTDSIPFVSMLFDSLHNRAGGSGGAVRFPYPVATTLTTQTYKFLLTINDTNTSTSVSTLTRTYPRPGHVPPDPAISFTAAPGERVAASVTFKSGDPMLTHIYPRDTINTDSITTAHPLEYKYGEFSPLVAYESDGTSNAAFPPYPNVPVGTDWTVGYFKIEGAGDPGGANAYTPTWGATTPVNNASAMQYPYISFHVVCPSCMMLDCPGSVNKIPFTTTINTYPNPADDQLTLSYTLANSAVATITLRNMLGQVVASQQTTNSATGNVTFNTGKLPDGIYIYTFEANGERTTGRVVVAH